MAIISFTDDFFYDDITGASLLKRDIKKAKV
jgi:hypothetical protein